MITKLFWLFAGMFLVWHFGGAPAPQLQAAPNDPLTGLHRETLAAEANPQLVAALTHDIQAPAPRVIAPNPYLSAMQVQPEHLAPVTVALKPVVFGNGDGSLHKVTKRDAPRGYVSTITPTPVTETPTVATAPDPAGPKIVITGNRVNLRAGPSTRNPVVETLTRGTQAVLVSRQGNWVELQVADSPVTGFMSANFISVVN